MMNLGYVRKGKKIRIVYGRIPVSGIGVDAFDKDSKAYVCLIKASHGHRIAADGASLGGGDGCGNSSGSNGDKVG